MSRAIIKFLTTVRGEQIQISRSFETGKVHFSPFKGSRNIPEAKEDAAPVGLPGLTVTWSYHQELNLELLQRSAMDFYRG